MYMCVHCYYVSVRTFLVLVSSQGISNRSDHCVQLEVYEPLWIKWQGDQVLKWCILLLVTHDGLLLYQHEIEHDQVLFENAEQSQCQLVYASVTSVVLGVVAWQWHRMMSAVCESLVQIQGKSTAYWVVCELASDQQIALVSEQT